MLNKKDFKILTKLWDQVDPMSVVSYRKKGGYESVRFMLRTLQPKQVLEEVKKSGLQGRGGAGFPTGQKWELATKVPAKEKYLICNLDESEPGTMKDRFLAEKNPHQLIEGLIIAAYALEVKKAYIYLNGKFDQARITLEKALQQAYAENYLGRSILGFAFDFDLELFSGAGAYICGEESALINSMEGKRGEPRFKPPYPSDCGLWGKPTVVNNAETLANLPWIIKHGGQKFSQIGLKDSPGTKIFSIQGSVQKPGVYEAPIGITISDLINHYAGGLLPGKQLWFCQIGGASGRIIPASLVDSIPSFSQAAAVTMGAGTILVMDKFQDPKRFLLSIVNFFQRESCGQCVPCREGTFRLKQIVERWVAGVFDRKDREDLEELIWTLDNTTFCPLGKFSVVALKDMLKYKICKF